MQVSRTFFHGPMMYLLGQILYKRSRSDNTSLITLCALRIQNKSILRIINRWVICSLLHRMNYKDELVLDQIRSVLTPEQHAELINTALKRARFNVKYYTVMHSNNFLTKLYDENPVKFEPFYKWARETTHLIVYGRYAEIKEPPAVIPAAKLSKYWSLYKIYTELYDMILSGFHCDPSYDSLFATVERAFGWFQYMQSIEQTIDLEARAEIRAIFEKECLFKEPLTAQLCGIN